MNSRSNISALSEDIIVDKLLLCHDPDGRWLDSEMLLQEFENIFSFVLPNDVFRPLMTDNLITNMEVFDSKETLPYAISRISVQMLCPCMGENEIQTRTMVLFDLLKEYRWDAKAVLVLGALAATYGGLFLPIHLAPSDPVAASIAALNQLPGCQKCTSMPTTDPLLQANPAEDDLPLQQYSREIAISELKEKVILLLLSNPQLLPIEPFHFLLQQLYDHPSDTDTEEKYEILWIPIPTSQKWTNEEKGIFRVFSNSLPWISVRRPWLMSSTVVNFLRGEWGYRDGETTVVVMDSNGRIVNTNAMDMVLIWGLRAYPFSVSREDELWEKDGWSIQLLLNGIHPVKEREEICIIGSENSTWVEEIKSLARKMQKLGFKFELIHLSRRSPDIQKLFWLRLQSIKRSKLRRMEPSKPDRVFQEANELLDFDYDTHKGWAIVGKESTEKIVGEKLMERMRRIVRWGENAAGLGFTEAIQNAANERPCEVSRTVVVPFEEGSTTGAVTCQNCKWPMKKFVAFQ